MRKFYSLVNYDLASHKGMAPLFVFLVFYAIMLFPVLQSSAQSCCPEFTLKDAVEICPPEGTCKGDAGQPAPGQGVGHPMAACKLSAHIYTVYPNTGGYTYTWTIIGGTPTFVPNSNPVTILWGNGSSGFIKVVISGNGCLDSISQEICLIDGPKADFIADADTVCQNTPVQFTNLSPGGGSVLWDFGDGNTSSQVHPIHSYSSPGVYNVLLTVTDMGSGATGDQSRACGCSDTIVKQIVVLASQGPVIETDCCYGTVCPDGTSSFCTPVVCPNYVWTVTGGTITTGAGTNCITVLWDATYSIPTTVSLEVPGCGNAPCPGKTTINVPVLYPNLPITGPTPLCVGASGSYSLPLLPGTYYTWTVTGGAYTFSQADLNTPNVNITFHTPGTFTVQCVYNNPLAGCSGLSTFLVDVLPPFQITSGRELVCETDTEPYFASNMATWSVTPAGATVPGGAQNPCNITWNTPGTYVVQAVTTTPGVFCNDTAYLVVEVLAKPVLGTISGPIMVCPGKNLIYGITSNVSGSPFMWTVNPGTGVIMSEMGADSDSIIVQLTGSGPWTINVFQQVEISPGYFCPSNTQSLVVNPFPLPVISGPTTVCVDAIETYIASGPTPPGGFDWSIDAPNQNRGSILTGQGSNTVTIRWHGTPTGVSLTVSNCSGSFSLPVTIVNPPFVADITANGPTEYCLPNTPSNLTLSVSPGFSYQWYQNGTPVGSNLPFYTIVSLPATPGVYLYTVEVSNGICTVSKSIVIVIGNCPPGGSPPPPFTCTMDFTINPNPACVNQPITFTAQAPFGGFQYAWDFGDFATSFTQITEHEYDNPGPYTVTLVAIFPNICTLTVVKQVIVNPLPVCTITASDTIFCPGSFVTLFGCGGMSAYQWYKDDAQIFGATNANYQANQPGEYFVEVTNANGCKSKSNAIYIYLHKLPVANITGQRSHCAYAGGFTQIQLSSVNNPAYVYDWSSNPPGATFIPNNSNAAASTWASLTLPGALPFSYEFIVKVTDQVTSCENYDTICVSFYETPPLSVGWQSGCEGTPYTLVPTPINTTLYHYQWSNGATTPVITVSAAGFYTLTITDKATGCSASGAAAMINPKPDLSLFPIGCATIQCDDTLDLYIPLPLLSTAWNNTYPLSYPVIQWFDNTNTLIGTGQTFPFTAANPGYHQIYVVVENYFGCVDTAGIFCITVVCGTTEEFDFGDAPDYAVLSLNYPTLLINNGARHLINPLVYLGSKVDPEPDGQPTLNANGDDNDTFYPSLGDDEDGVNMPSTVYPGLTVVLNVQASVAGFLHVWMDFNADGDWADLGENIFTSQPLSAGANVLAFTVPSSASPGMSYARFRFTTATGFLNYDGLASDGEVEDYVVCIMEHPPCQLDYGDAPLCPDGGPGYPTLLGHNGARHMIVPGIYLGNLIDADLDGMPSILANGDDLSNVDDEDGVTMPSSVAIGSSVTITVVASVAGYLDAWMDFNINCSWADPGEHIFNAVPLSAGSNILTFNVPGTATAGQSYTRFRFRTFNAPIGFSGLVTDGEVEDYAVFIEEIQPQEDLDFGDAPGCPAIGSGYPTLLADNGARHIIVPGVYLGSLIDAEPDGQPSFMSDGDDLNGLADEDGVSIPPVVGIGWTVNITVTASTTGFLDAWMDFNMNCSWADAGEHIFSSVPLNAGANSLTFSVPLTASMGQSYVRFRFRTSSAPISFDGLVNDGEVEDYAVFIEEFPQPSPEYGDAPEGALAYPGMGVMGQFPTCVNVGPAGSFIEHAPNYGAFFGPAFDYEPEGNAGLCPSFNPNLYNMDECFQDGDAGLIRPAPYTITGSIGSEIVVPCNDAQLTIWRTCKEIKWGTQIDIQVQNFMPTVAFVNVLIDWNQNGQWGGVSGCGGSPTSPEHVLMNFTIPAGFSGALSSLTPPNFIAGPRPGYVWARFSVTETPVAQGWDGSGTFDFGETEDYLIRVWPSAVVPIDLNLGDIIITPLLDTCFAATQTITVAGNGTTFVVESGGSVELVAGHNILFLPGTNVVSGGYLLGRITTTDEYCENEKSLVTSTIPEIVKENNPSEIWKSASFFRVFPNPTSGMITVELNEATEEQITVEIYNIIGERILRSEYHHEIQHQLDISGKQPGMYLIRVSKGNDTAVEKLIKR